MSFFICYYALFFTVTFFLLVHSYDVWKSVKCSGFQVTILIKVGLYSFFLHLQTSKWICRKMCNLTGILNLSTWVQSWGLIKELVSGNNHALCFVIEISIKSSSLWLLRVIGDTLYIRTDSCIVFHIRYLQTYYSLQCALIYFFFLREK